jgi:hypothetical protein
MHHVHFRRLKASFHFKYRPTSGHVRPIFILLSIRTASEHSLVQRRLRSSTSARCSLKFARLRIDSSHRAFYSPALSADVHLHLLTQIRDRDIAARYTWADCESSRWQTASGNPRTTRNRFWQLSIERTWLPARRSCGYFAGETRGNFNYCRLPRRFACDRLQAQLQLGER